MRYLVTGRYTYYHCGECTGHRKTCRFTIDLSKPDEEVAQAAAREIIRSQYMGMQVDFDLKILPHYGASEYFS